MARQTRAIANNNTLPRVSTLDTYEKVTRCAYYGSSGEVLRIRETISSVLRRSSTSPASSRTRRENRNGCSITTVKYRLLRVPRNEAEPNTDTDEGVVRTNGEQPNTRPDPSFTDVAMTDIEDLTRGIRGFGLN